MKTYTIPTLAILLSALLLMFLFGPQSQRVDMKQYEHLTNVLTQLKDQDVRMNEHMLLAGSGMLRNFDSMVDITNRLNKQQEELSKLQSSMSEEARESLETGANRLFLQLKQKILSIEQFKADHSILRNSQGYLPIAVEQTAPKLSIEIRAKLYDLTSDVYIYITKPSQRLRQHINAMITAFKQQNLHSKSMDKLDNIFSHIDIILSKTDELHMLARTILRQPTVQLVEDIEHLQQGRHAENVHHTDNVMLLMSMLAVLLLFYAAYVMYRLRRAASELEEAVSELEYQKFALDQHSIVAATDRTGRITYANDKFCEISQYSREELLGQDHRLLNSGYHPRSFFKEMWQTIGKGKAWHQEVKNRKKDGSFYWVDTSIIPFMGQHGKVERYIAIRTDITQRKEEEARSASLARFSSENPAPVMRINHHGELSYANAASKYILDALEISIHEKLPSEMLQECMIVLTDKQNRSSELVAANKVFELTYASLPGTDDVNLYARDITEIKDSIEAIETSEKRIRQVMDTALDGMIMVDSHAKITYWNPQAEKIFGRSAEEMIGTSGLYQLFPKDQMIMVQKQFSSVLNQRIEIVARHKDGFDVPIELSVMMIKTKGVFDYFSITIHDVSERINSEKALKEARDQALESSKMKSMFLSTVSHEIRTPMNGIIGMTDLLLDTPLNAEQREFTRTIHASSDALLMIINDILDFSKVEAGHLDIEQAAFSLHSMVEGAVGVVAIKANDKGIALNLFIDPTIPAALIGDTGRLRQVILNLVDNAVKFTEQGEVNIRIMCQEKIDDHIKVSFFVRDTGIGLSPDAQKRLFQPFVQADGTTTRKYGGTGLGLAISKKIIQLMGGDIQLHSELGKGSEFSFALEFEASEDLELINAGYNVENLAGLNILVVDDDANACFILDHYLSHWDIEVTSTESSAAGLEALELAAANNKPFDLMIIDHHMPNQTGLEMAEYIRQQSAYTETPMILHTGHDHFGLKQKALDVGFNSLLPKPINMSHLFDCLAQALRLDSVEENSITATQPLPDETLDAQSGIHVLLAEDNPVNQKVAQTHLSKLGCIVHTVENGQEAVHTAMAADIYDIIFMDCQMPIMDGLEATRHIRAYEKEHGGSRIIIAMTANAMKGDREICLQAGMNDYMSKPVSREKISEAINRNLIDSSEESSLRHGSDDREAHASYINLDQLKDLFGDDDEAIAEILQLFQHSMQQLLMEKMPLALRLQDALSMKQLAHDLKGASANIGGDDVASICAQIEELAEAEQWDSIEAKVAHLHEAYEQLKGICSNLGAQA